MILFHSPLSISHSLFTIILPPTPPNAHTFSNNNHATGLGINATVVWVDNPNQPIIATPRNSLMSVAVITGSAGLIGSEAARFFAGLGMDVVGIDNDMRKVFFGDEASTSWNRLRLEQNLDRYTHYDLDIRAYDAIKRLFARYGNAISLVIHTAPSHDWAAHDPFTDFTVNATLNLLQATPEYCYSDQHRSGDHIWYVSDLSQFKQHYLAWTITRTVPEILQEIYEVNLERWAA